MNTHYIRLFTDTDGESHFEEVETELTLTEFAPSSPPLGLSTPVNASHVAFLRAPVDWIGDWHVSAARNLFVVISGEWEVEASDGERRTFGPNSILLVEDTSGKGHRSHVLSNSLAVVVQLS